MSNSSSDPGPRSLDNDHPPLAALLVLCAMAMLSFQDALIKVTSDQFSIWQFQFLRALANLAFSALIIIAFGRDGRILPKRPWAVLLRGFLLVGAMVCFFSGIPFLSLSEIAAGLYLYPLLVVVLSGTLLGERVGAWRITAVVIGLIGSLLILKPGTDAFKFVALLPVCAAVFYAGMVLSTRHLCRGEAPLTLAMGVAFAFVVVGTIGLAIFPSPDAPGASVRWPYLLTGWHPLAWSTFGVVLVCSVLNLTSNVCLARAYQSAEPTWLAPFDYCYLLFATFWGYVIWTDIPDGATFAGMALIALGGIIVALRQRRQFLART